MGRIKLPSSDYTEISYGDGESYGSGTDQLEVVKWVGFGLGCATVAGSIFVGIHRAVQGYWIWDRELAAVEPRHRETYKMMNQNERRWYWACTGLEYKSKDDFMARCIGNKYARRS